MNGAAANPHNLDLCWTLSGAPAAAAATLRTRAATADTEDADEADAIGRRTVFDLMEEDTAEAVDLAPGSDPGEDSDDNGPLRSRLLRMARAADALHGKKDAKLQKAFSLVETLLNDGYRPILFCRFIPTAEYVAASLREKLRGVEVIAITGNMPPVEREERTAQLSKSDKRVLVCTDCLSEGINLQQHFDAVVHYDLSWNPTRHEQREGRVDRYGQPSPKVRTLTYCGIDNQIDGIVLNVLLRKHKAIRNSLGISVPVPTDSDQVIQAVFEGLLLRGKTATDERLLPGMDEFLESEVRKRLHQQWDASTEREKRSRTVFAQETIKVDEVTRELKAAREAIGSGVDVADFTQTALQAYRAVVRNNGALKVDLKETPRSLRDMLSAGDQFEARFEPPVTSKQLLLTRTHPVVEKLANHVLKGYDDWTPWNVRNCRGGE